MNTYSDPVSNVYSIYYNINSQKMEIKATFCRMGKFSGAKSFVIGKVMVINGWANVSIV